MKFLNITENGSGRIHFSKTPKDIGLAITGLTTCTAIVILGDKGISVIHDESYLSIASIEQEFAFVGTVKEWSIFFNPSEPMGLKGDELSNRITAMTPLIEKYKENYIHGDDGNLFRASQSGCLSVPRKTEQIVEVNISLIQRESLTEPKDSHLRTAVRHLNNMYAYYLLEEEKQTQTARIVPIDIQFDGIKQTEPAPLICENHDKVRQVVNCLFKVNKILHKEYFRYCTIACKTQGTSFEMGMFSQPKTSQSQHEERQFTYAVAQIVQPLTGFLPD